MKKSISIYKLISVLFIVLLIIMFLFVNIKNPKQEKLYQKSGFFFDTIISINIYDTNPAHAENVLNECINICDKYENLYSVSLSDSEISNINIANGAPTKVSSETIDILKKAEYYSSLSDKEVTPDVYPLTRLWDEAKDNLVLPDETSITEALSHTGKGYSIAGNSLILNDAKSGINLGFIAKGYIADKLKEYILSQGIQSGIINLGGNVLCIGQKPDGSDFNIGIRNPLKPDDSNPIYSLNINNKSIVSSGDYERYFEIDNQKYHHILSLENGYPVQTNLKQVTIISDSSTEGDALSTICFILGYDKSVDLLVKHFPDASAIFVDDQGNIMKYPNSITLQ